MTRRRRRRPHVVRRGPDRALDESCYLCDAMVKRNDEVVRHHGLMIHRQCYEADIRKGR